VLDHGKVRGFPSYAEANALLDSWLQKYPDLLQRHVIGHSYEGRELYAYSLFDRKNRLFEKCPQVLLTSLMHAREPAGLTVVLYFIGRTLELHEQADPEATYALRSREVWAVPFVNPDGYVANENLLHKVIRKNLRPTCDESPEQSTYQHQSGIDLNRNFGFHWSPQYKPCNEEYQGSAPFSEPETQALKQLIEAHDFKTAVNFHSYGGMLTHPYNFGAKRLRADDQEFYDEIAKVFDWPRFGPALATVGYPAPGESDDWMYSAHHILSMSPEVGPESGGFWPSSTLVQGIDERNYRRIMYVVTKAGFEFNASWKPHDIGTTYTQGYLPNLSASSGGPAADVLELRIGNSGLTDSGSKVLSIAISGATRPNVQGVGANDVSILRRYWPQADRALQISAQLSYEGTDAAAGPFVSFQVDPLPNRSHISLQVLMAANLAAVSPQRLGICAVEAVSVERSVSPALCQCVGSLPAGQFVAVELVKAGAESPLGQLCRAAAAAGTKVAASPQLRTTGLVQMLPEVADPKTSSTLAEMLSRNSLFLSLVVVAVLAGMSISRAWPRSASFRAVALEEEMMPTLQVNATGDDACLESMHDFYKV